MCMYMQQDLEELRCDATSTHAGMQHDEEGGKGANHQLKHGKFVVFYTMLIYLSLLDV